MRRLVTLTAVLAMMGVACGGESPEEPADAPRTIEIEALDDLRFEPASVSVAAGETIRFVVHNRGELAHEFVLGDEDVQDAHETASDAEHEHVGGLIVLELEPGETEETTQAFDDAGELIYGCHEPGHYSGGMRGTLSITE
jgi:uncharacterized cupredoxin-like copper-binding protein